MSKGYNGVTCAMHRFSDHISNGDTNNYNYWIGNYRVGMLLHSFFFLTNTLTPPYNTANYQSIPADSKSGFSHCPMTPTECTDVIYYEDVYSRNKCSELINELHKIDEKNTKVNNLDFSDLSTILSAAESIMDIAYTLSDFEELVDKLVKLKDSTIVSMEKTLSAFLIILLIAVVLEIVVQFLIFFDAFSNAKLVLIFHILWNIISGFTVGTFFLSGIFGLFVSFGMDTAVVIRYIFSGENLDMGGRRIFMSRGEAQNIFNQCMNNFGTLETTLGLSDNKAYSDFSSLYRDFKYIENSLVDPEEFTKETDDKYKLFFTQCIAALNSDILYSAKGELIDLLQSFEEIIEEVHFEYDYISFIFDCCKQYYFYNL